MASDVQFWLVQTLNGLQLSVLLFLLSVGLTVIFGLMHFVNLAHGALYALGAYAGVTASAFFGSYWAGFAAAPVVVMLAGVVLYLGLIRRMRGAGPMNQVLVTFGLMFMFIDLFRIIWGNYAIGLPQPAYSGWSNRVLRHRLSDLPAFHHRRRPAGDGRSRPDPVTLPDWRDDQGGRR